MEDFVLDCERSINSIMNFETSVLWMTTANTRNLETACSDFLEFTTFYSLYINVFWASVVKLQWHMVWKWSSRGTGISTSPLGSLNSALFNFKTSQQNGCLQVTIIPPPPPPSSPQALYRDTFLTIVTNWWAIRCPQSCQSLSLHLHTATAPLPDQRTPLIIQWQVRALRQYTAVTMSGLPTIVPDLEDNRPENLLGIRIRVSGLVLDWGMLGRPFYLH